MSSTLHISKTPAPPKSYDFAYPVKALIGKRYYDHDGSLGGSTMTIGPSELKWFQGVLDAAKFHNDQDRRDFEKVVSILQSGNSIDMWFTV